MTVLTYTNEAGESVRLRLEPPVPLDKLLPAVRDSLGIPPAPPMDAVRWAEIVKASRPR